MSPAAPHRRRIAVGLALGLLVAAGLTYVAERQARAGASREQAVRRGVVAIRALAEVVERAGVRGDAVRRAVGAFAREDPSLASIRAVAFEGISLEASTDPEDRGERAAPRRLAREEKPLYDLGQRLRAAVETNRQEGAARKPEIETDWTPSGGLALAVPLEHEGAVAGLLTLGTPAVPPPPATSLVVPVGVAVAALALFLLGSLALGERRGALLALAIVLLAAAAFVVGGSAARTVSADVRATEEAVAQAVKAEAAHAGRALREIGAGDAASLHPDQWDVDVFRRPRGVVTAAEAVDPAAVARALDAAGSRIKRLAGTFAVLGLGVLLFVGMGSAGRLGATLKKHHQAYAYTFPALFGMLVLVFLPFLYGVALSFTDYSLYSSQAPLSEIWVGLKNFAAILGDFHIATHTAAGLAWNYQNIYWTLFITVIWTVTNVAYGVGMGLFLALILNTKALKLRAIYRVIFVLPWAMPNYITALIWKGMFHQQFGVINQVIQMFGGTPVAWFEKTSTSLFACIATNAWLSVPFMMVISLGALQSIPSDLYEAARVDGAGRWQQFRSITLPSLKPALIPAIILSVIWTFNMFNIIYLVSAGEPAHSTEILITQAYKFAFEQYRYGYAAAYSMVIFAILLAYGVWQNKVTKATEGI